jgi:hypothetical protein
MTMPPAPPVPPAPEVGPLDTKHLATQFCIATQSEFFVHALPSIAHTPSNVVSGFCFAAHALATQLWHESDLALQPFSTPMQVLPASALHLS